MRKPSDGGTKRHPSLFAILGGAAAVVIVVASLLVRMQGPADPAADVGDQRADVTWFHDLVQEQRWTDVYRATSEPPAKDASAFARLMDKQVAANGEVTAIDIESLRLLRSRSVPLLEVHEVLTVRQDGDERTERTVSYFARRGERWLFAFSAPDTAA